MRRNRNVCIPMVSLLALLVGGLLSAGPGEASPVKNWAAIDQWPDFTTGTWVNTAGGRGLPPPGTKLGGGGKPAGGTQFGPGVDGAQPPYKPEIAAKLAGKTTGATSCEPAGVITDPGSKFFFGKDIIVIGGMSDWYNTWRRVYMNRTTHGDDPEPTYFGDSIGHWEGKTLVIDTVAIREEARLGSTPVNNYSTHMIERYRLKDPNTLELVKTVINPDVLTKPWVTTILLKRDTTSDEFPEAYCWKDREASGDNPDFTPPN